MGTARDTWDWCLSKIKAREEGLGFIGSTFPSHNPSLRKVDGQRVLMEELFPGLTTGLTTGLAIGLTTGLATGLITGLATGLTIGLMDA